jgi:protein O-GlcNAc transferase
MRGDSANAPAGQIQQALGLIREGRLLQADVLCRQVLAHEPKNFNALQLLGLSALQRQDYLSAADWLTAAVAVNRASAAAHSNLAVAWLALRRPREALECCDDALRLQASYPEALCNRGHALCALERPAEALDSYRRALCLAPGFYDALSGSVNALMTLKRFEDALMEADRLVQVAPSVGDAWCRRGMVLLQLARAEAALSAFDRALLLAPDSPQVLNNRGTALRDLRRPAEALASYRRALALRPAFAEAYCNLANLCLDRGDLEEALGHCEEALRVGPDLHDALNIRGTALRALKRYADAAATYEQLLARTPRFGHALSHLLFSRASLCDWRQWAEQTARVTQTIRAGESASTPHTFLWMSESADDQLRCARLFTAEQFPMALHRQGALHRPGARYRHDRLRIGYLSADFGDHPVAHLIAGVLEHHDRTRFETAGISLQRTDSGDMTRRMQQAFEHFHDVSDLSDHEVAAKLRDWEIDIAVDLTGHTRDGRLGILALRPAPVQVSYLGFTGTLGASFVDYLIADEVAIPPDQDRFFSERIARLPYCYLPNDDAQRVATEAPSRADLGLPDEAFVFCALHNTYKLNPPVFEVWMRLLRDTPGSVLWLRGGEPAMRSNLGREARSRGVAPERLVFAERLPSMEIHLARYRRADLFLDALPYGGHATARDALWAGLPVLTCAREAFASRVAASQLRALGLAELVTTSLEEYGTRALELAHSPVRLAELRERLADHKSARPVFATDLYRKHLESAYATMAERQRLGEVPVSFSVAALQ